MRAPVDEQEDIQIVESVHEDMDIYTCRQRERHAPERL